jgi:hypothetical protein
MSSLLLMMVFSCKFGEAGQMPPTSPIDWETASDNAQQQRRMGRAMKIAGAVMIPIGIGGMIYGRNASWHQPPSFSTCHPAVALFYPQDGTCRPTVPAERVANHTILWSGAGVTGLGVIMVWRGSSSQKKAADRLQQLEEIRRDRGWSVSLNQSGGPSLQIAFRW